MRVGVVGCVVVSVFVGFAETFTQPTTSCSDYLGTDDKCDAHTCFAHGNGYVDTYRTSIQEQCDDWGAFSSIDTKCVFFQTTQGEDDPTKNWNLDVDGVEDGCSDNGTVASTHTCHTLSCSDYTRTSLSATKISQITALWTTSFGTTYDGWQSIVTQCETNTGVTYNYAASHYPLPATSDLLTAAAYYLDALSTFSACFSCGNGVRQIINDTTLDVNFGNRFYRLGTLYAADKIDAVPSTFQNTFIETCDDGNLISGDGCTGCNYIAGSDFDDADSTNTSIFGLPFPWACACTADVFGYYFCPTQACQVEDGWVCREDVNQTSHCKTNLCGNSYVQYENNEECDDGNLIDGDGCSANCTVELGWDCTEQTNANGLWREATYFDLSPANAISVCAYLPRFETPKFEVGFLVEFYNTTRNLTTWTNSSGWEQALQDAGNVRDIECPILKTLDDPSQFVSCYKICNRSDSTFTCNKTNLFLVPVNFTYSCYQLNSTSSPNIVDEFFAQLNASFPIPGMNISLYNFTTTEGAEYAQLWYLPRFSKLSETWATYDNRTGNFTAVFQISANFSDYVGEARVGELLDNITSVITNSTFATRWWQNSIASFGSHCLSRVPLVLNDTITRTCSDPNITYASYHQQWCDNCCQTNTSLFTDRSSAYYFSSCDDYWYQVTISREDMDSCWNGREFNATDCVTDPCYDTLLDEPIVSEYCTYFNFFKNTCGKPFNDTLTTPIFVVDYLLTQDPCGHCRSDEFCPVWYGLECDTCDGCQLLADSNGECDCDARFVVGGFNTTGEVHVTALSMRANNISGTIIGAFSNLTYLQSVFLNENHISAFGSDILWERFSVLRKFHMRQNSLSGTVPSAVKYIKSLEELDLSYNALVAVAQDAFSETTCCDTCNCTSKLEYINLSVNNISGSVPWSLSRLPRLRQLQVSNNKLQSFGSFFLSQAMTSVNFANNSIADDLASLDTRGFFTTQPLQKLLFLDMSNNKIYGSLPNSIRFLTGLEDWRVNANQISGSTPFALGSLTNLKYLQLQNNLLANDLNPNLNNLQKLEYLDVSTNFIESMPSLFAITTLRTLNISSNWLGSLPDLRNLRNLEILDIRDNGLVRLPSSLSNLFKLRRLYASQNLLGSLLLLPAFSDMDGLEVLDLSQNTLTGTLPENIAMASIREINLSNNMIGGSAPPSLLASPTLVSMDLSHNEIEYVPDAWSYLPQLQYLNISYNWLSTTIPTTLGDLPSILILDLHNNSLTGDIPSTFGALASVEYIDLSNNNLHGIIPTELGTSLVSLQTLNVENNGLTGTLPGELLDAPQLSNLQLGGSSGNHLTGFLPATLCERPSITNFLLENSGLFWCPFPCWESPLTSNIQCKNCPADQSTYCAGDDTLCPTCSFHGSCSFGDVLAESQFGTCNNYTDLFSGPALEKLDCPGNCTYNGICNNRVQAVQCACDATVAQCSLDLTDSFYNQSSVFHPAVTELASTTSAYSILQNPLLPLHFDPLMDQTRPYCKFGTPTDGNCYNFASGAWTVSSDPCWYVDFLVAFCECDTGFGGDNCETDLTRTTEVVSVWIDSASHQSVTIASVLVCMFTFLMGFVFKL